ncbi:MAG: cytochrome-c oxidase, cbb3-type subunit II [Gammaproteobacteria bacterium]|nr:cytochrome-c oxidase, cbb3-type subunit II [Gammaproteobacteria bacterium]
MNHDVIEKNTGLMGVLIALVISVAGFAEIVPLMYQAQTTQPSPGVEPFPALQLAGRDVYVKEGCYNCHSQMIRPFVSERLRYGPPTAAGETVYERPFQWGSKRTGPDLARVGGRYTYEWHLAHLINPRDLVPESNMPGYPWLLDKTVDGELVERKMRTLKWLGDPYTQEQIDSAAQLTDGVSEMDALIAYLQYLGLSNNARGQQ